MSEWQQTRRLRFRIFDIWHSFGFGRFVISHFAKKRPLSEYGAALRNGRAKCHGASVNMPPCFVIVDDGCAPGTECETQRKSDRTAAASRNWGRAAEFILEASVEGPLCLQVTRYQLPVIGVHKGA